MPDDMPVHDHTVYFDSPEDTAAWAVRLAQRLDAGDTILLTGPVGAGKTALARALIQSILPVPEDVPSPTFTLVQQYDTLRGTLVHADLYRLTGADEIEELGLADAMQDAICLIEWPDRLGPYTPHDALAVTLSAGAKDTERLAELRWSDARWTDRVAA
ncbi:MAG: tRNA (adenosine(37)-N6)-threonylcarbamoyltransferase complex ATPase subunit type 1 TsaE [Pseudomonadota bacterium]